MELRHLRYFVTLAEELHFGHAAERLHIAQPALSQQVRRLEEELGVQLLHRTKRRVRLSPAGEAFLEHARGALARAQDAVLAAQQASRGGAGHLAIGYVTSALYGVVPDIIRLFRERARGVHLSLHEMPIVQQLEWLREGRIQACFLRPPVDQPGVQVKTIVREHWVAALPATHPLSGRARIPLQALAEEQFILFPRELAPQLYDHLLSSVYQKGGFNPKIALEAQMHTIAGLVAAGVGIALVPASLQNLRRSGLVYRPLRDSVPKVELAVAWRRDDPSPLLRRFLETVPAALGRSAKPV